LAIIRLKNKNQNKFLLSVLDSVVMKKYINQSISVGAQPNLNLQQINDFRFNLPSIPEQEKIASFLTSVDKRISLLEQKKENLELYKKGVMQKLFSQEIRFKPDDNGASRTSAPGSTFVNITSRATASGSTFVNGASRASAPKEPLSDTFEEPLFAPPEEPLSEALEDNSTKTLKAMPEVLEGGAKQTPKANYPDWEEKKGNKIFSPISNKNHNSDLPVLAITQDKGAIPREQINYNISVSEASISSYKVVEKGDFIISLRSFQGGIEYSNYKGICSPAYIILRPYIKIDHTFYKYYFKTHNYIQELQKRLEGIRDGKMISYKYFSEIKLPYPTLPEQQKIANFLSSIDTKIELVAEALEATRDFKKGLLQQMFV